MFRIFPLLCLLLLAGCKTSPVRHIAVSPAVSVSKAGEVEVSGDAQTASNVNTAQTGSKMVVPEGSKFEFNEKLGTMTLVMAKASEIAVNRTETAIQGPVAFTPDKGPTIGEEMKAKSAYWTRLGLMGALVIGVSAAIFGLVRGWNFVMYGGISMAGAALFGLFVQSHPVLMIFIGAGIAAIVMAVIIWHTRLKKYEGTPEEKKEAKPPA